jgi:class 3 adenylate cyclase/tetratricopeptide (TPR) repeat protein
MPHESRRTVTIVFADVSGSTSLGEQLDPEPLRRVMASYFEEMSAAVERHGGTVEKFIGDAVMAVFGIPQLHEDDALRAVRAAWDMRAALERLNAELEAERRITLAVRTGVNTGEVVAGDPSGGEFYATGDAVNVAARLEQAAAPGEILLGESTYRLVRDVVSAEPVEPLELKGKTAAVAAWRLVGVRDVVALQRRLDAPLVGRAPELARLQEAYARVREERRCGLCTVLGVPGVGKSRLAGELGDRVAHEATVLWGRCLSYGEGITFWPLVEVLREVDIAGVLAGDDERELIEEQLSGLLGERPSGSLEETFWAVRKLFEALARMRPLVVVFDDVHWAEPTFLDLVEHIVEWSQEAAVLVVTLARPEFLDQRPLWAAQREDFTLLRLEPLSEGEAELLLENLTKEARLLPEEQRRRITESSEGNPLFVEQMVAMLAENGRRDDGDLAVPPTIQALLAARLDQLAPDERAVVEPAAVVGKEFWRSAVVELAPADVQVSASLQRLVRKEFVRPDRSRLAGEDGFRFRHVLIRDAAYAGISKGQRARLHEHFAGWLESRYPEFAEIVGYHLEQAYRYAQELGSARADSEALAHRAAEQLGAAGLRAWERGDMRAAVNLLERSVTLLPRGDGLRLALLPELGSALEDIGRLDEAEALLAEAAREAAEAGNRRAEMRARIQFALVHLAHADLPVMDEIQPLTDEAIRVFEELGDDEGLAITWHLLSYPGWAALRWQEMGDALERALVHARRAGSRVRVESCLAWLTACYAFGPLPVDEAIVRTQEIRAEFEPGTYGDASALAFLGWLEAMRGDFAAGRNLYRQGIERLLELGASLRRGGRSIVGGDIEMLAGDPVAAEAELREGFRILNEMGEKGILSTVAANLAEALYRQGRYNEAWEMTRISEEATAPEDLASQVGWRGVRAKVLARRGEFEEAERLSVEALRLIEDTDGLPQYAQTLEDRADVLRLEGRVDEARRALEEAIRRCEAKGMVAGVRNGRALLSELDG